MAREPTAAAGAGAGVLMSRLALATSPGYPLRSVGALLAPYARAQGWDNAALAARLGCTPAALPRLLSAPAPRAECWEAHVAAAALSAGADPEALAGLLRAASAYC